MRERSKVIDGRNRDVGLISFDNNAPANENSEASSASYREILHRLHCVQIFCDGGGDASMQINKSCSSNSSGVLKNARGRILVEKWPVIAVKQNCQRARS
jgi:hypothetical protein